MAKSVKEAVAAKRKKKQADDTSAVVTVAQGFKREFTKSELEEIKLKRRQMSKRLYAAG